MGFSMIVAALRSQPSGGDSRFQTYKLETTLEADPAEAVESLLVLMTSPESASSTLSGSAAPSGK